jgi:hypothetical protein
MNRLLLAIVSTALGSVAAAAFAGPPPGGGRYMAPPGAYPGAAYRYGYAGFRPVYPGWRGGYWGPNVGVYYGGAPGYWGAWPYAWNAGYAWPYAVAPLVVNTAPAPQVFLQQEPLVTTPAPAPAEPSYWYYCTQPAGYFPYVQDCSHAWMKVVPQVPGAVTTPPRLAP